MRLTVIAAVARRLLPCNILVAWVYYSPWLCNSIGIRLGMDNEGHICLLRLESLCTGCFLRTFFSITDDMSGLDHICDALRYLLKYFKHRCTDLTRLVKY